MARPGKPTVALEALADLLVSKEKVRLKLTGTSTPGGRDDDTARRLLPIPFGDVGDVLLIVDDGGDIVASWEPLSGTGVGFQYRDYTYANYGGGYFLFDHNGDAIYTLASLE